MASVAIVCGLATLVIRFAVNRSGVRDYWVYDCQGLLALEGCSKLVNAPSEKEPGDKSPSQQHESRVVILHAILPLVPPLRHDMPGKLLLRL